MTLPSMRKSIVFANSMVGRQIYAYSSADGAIVMEEESVHGGPRIGEPGAVREVLTEYAILAKLLSDSVKQSNTLAGKAWAWLQL
eukprot:COSAG01_NODE_5867_length_3982_cov_7.929178_5_plen_85_part_00